MIPDYTDVRRKPCAGCGRQFVPPGAGNGMCSDRCWMAARSRRQEPQTASLDRAMVRLSDQADRHVNTYRPLRVTDDLAERAAVALHLAGRAEVLRLIRRAPRSRRRPVSRGEQHTGPDCEICRAGRALEARR